MESTPIRYPEAVPLACNACEARWELRMKLPMPLKDFTNRIGAERCPVCQSADVVIVTDDDENAIFYD